MTFTLRAALATATFFALPAHALDISHLEDHQLLQYSHHLAVSSSPTQWQPLWQTARQAGLFASPSEHLHFTLAQPQLPGTARLVLQQPDSIERQLPARTRLRRDFAPLAIGAMGSRSFTALCVLVDWRHVPPHVRPDDAAALEQARLVNIEPC